MRYFIDIDGTICHTNLSYYEKSQPIIERIKKVNDLFLTGDEIHYWTARGAESGKDWSELTKKQLVEWGCMYTTLNMKKPSYDVWVDDKAINAKVFFENSSHW